jgi:hypothetical protein
MALFKSAEEKAAKAAEKEQKLLEKYNLTALSDPEDIESVRKIVSELVGTGLMELGLALGAGSEKDILKMQLNFQRAIVEQNFIIIRQLDKISKALTK